VCGLLIALALSVALPGPDGAFKDAALDLAENIAPDDRRFTRYLSLYSTPDRYGPDVAHACGFWSNSLSYRRAMVHPALVADGSLIRLDLRQLGWDKTSRAERAKRTADGGVKLTFDADIWETLARRDPYFKVTTESHGTVYRGWIDPAIERAARKLSHSTLFVVRADWFLRETGFDRNATDGRVNGLYSDFLLLPDNESDLLKVLGTDAAFVGRETLAAGGAVIQSGVALHNRAVEIIPTLLGGPERFLWRTYDVINNQKDQSVLTNFVGDNGFSTVKRKGGELIFELPNGLHAYYVINGAGKQLGEVPTNVAFRRGSVPDPVIYNAWSCLACHGGGINPFSDVITTLAVAPGVGLAAIDKDKHKLTRRQQQIEDYHLAKLAGVVDKHSRSYRAAIKASNGLEAPRNAAVFVATIERYAYGLVDLSRAAREMGVSEAEAVPILKRSGNADALAISAGVAVPRDAFEKAYQDIMQARVYSWDRTGKAIRE
jgi:hypothetical protein